MELFLKNTSHGLIPMYDDDYEEKRKLKIGEVYKSNIVLVRNPLFHAKYFAMINCAWMLQNEKRKQFFKNTNGFRKSVQIAAGHCDMVYNHNLKSFTEVPKSIAWNKVDNAEFEEIYKNARHVIDTIFCKNITLEEFEKYLANF